MNLKFYKGPTRPTNISAGSVWFNTTAKRIELITGTSTSEIYGGEINSASYNNNILKITKIDGSSITVDLSSLASITDIENTLASKLNKIKINGYDYDYDINLVDGNGITIKDGITSGNKRFVKISTFPFTSGEISSGTISLDHLPKGALERLFIFASEKEALNSTDVSEGDTVQITNNDNQMYFCVSNDATTFDTKFHPYTAGTATSVPWSGILGKPDVYTPDTHTHTVSDITDFPTNVSSFTNDAGYITNEGLNEKNALVLMIEQRNVNWTDVQTVNWDKTKIDEAIENNIPIYVLYSYNDYNKTRNFRFIYTGKDTQDSYSFICTDGDSILFLSAKYASTTNTDYWYLTMEAPNYVEVRDIEYPTKIFTTSGNNSDSASYDVSTNNYSMDLYYRSNDDYVSEHTVGTLHVGTYTQDINVPLLKIDSNEVSNNSLTLGEYLTFDSSANSLSVDLTNSNYVTQDDLTNSNYATKDEIPSNTEVWTFTMSNGTTYDKTVYLG